MMFTYYFVHVTLVESIKIKNKNVMLEIQDGCQFTSTGISSILFSLGENIVQKVNDHRLIIYYNKCSLILNLNSHTDYQKHIIQFIFKDGYHFTK